MIQDPLFFSDSFSVLSSPVKPAGNLLGFEKIDKGLGINRPHSRDHLVGFRAGNNRVNHAALRMIIGAFPFQDGSPMMRDGGDGLTDLSGLIGHDKECPLLVLTIKGMQDDSGRILINDRIQRPVPSKEQPGHRQDNSIDSQDDMEGIDPFLVREKDTDKIRPAGCRPGHQYDTDNKAINDTAEYTDQEDVIRHKMGRDKVCKKARQYDYQAGIQGKFFPDIPKADVDRYGIEYDIDERIWQLHIQISDKNLLDQQRQACRPTREKIPRPDKGLDIHSREK